nr:hypothetical protein [Streptomyces sp. DSM 41633]
MEFRDSPLDVAGGLLGRGGDVPSQIGQLMVIQIGFADRRPGDDAVGVHSDRDCPVGPSGCG